MTQGVSRGNFWWILEWSVTQGGLERQFLVDFGVVCDAEGSRVAVFGLFWGGQ